MNNNLQQLARLIRYYSLVSTTAAGSGHPTSSLSAADLMAALMFGGHFRFDLDNPQNPANDRLIFSKGHASPLFYSVYAAAGKVSEAEMKTLRKFDSPLEGHPTLNFPYTEVPTGSLGQGLSVGLGMALSAKLDGLPYRTYVLLGDSEMAEGSVWEAVGVAAHYKLNNLIAVLDVNRLGQRGETMLGWDAETYRLRAEAFGWRAVVVDGHDFEGIQKTFQLISLPADKPLMIVAKTIKGKGVSFLENQDSWHGKALTADELETALAELGEIDKTMAGLVEKPAEVSNFQIPSPDQSPKSNIPFTDYSSGKPVATRKAYGNILPKVFEAYPNAVALDAETSNSTYADSVKKTHPQRFFEMYIAEQNMVGTALGMSRRGKLPFVSTFAAFFSRAFDQIRMSQYAGSDIKFIGSHAGVSIGQDGSSQMGLEELAMFRALRDSVVLYPSDAVSAEKLVVEAAKHRGNVYVQTTRQETPILYGADEQFPIGGSKVLRFSGKDAVTVIGAGITVHEALAAYEELQKEGIVIRVIDLYSIKPIDGEAIRKAAEETKTIITVEDNYPEGGIGEAVAGVLAQMTNIKCQMSNLAVRKIPRSGKPEELLAYEEIDRKAIVNKVKELVHSTQ